MYCFSEESIPSAHDQRSIYLDEEHIKESDIGHAKDQSYETREEHIVFGCSLSPDKRLRFVEAKTKLTAKASSQPILAITYRIGDLALRFTKIGVTSEMLYRISFGSYS